MSLILSGTDGLSDVDGSAATPAIRGTDANTGIFFPAADQVAITTGGTQRAVVDASGNVGVGTSSPLEALDVFGNAVIGRTAASGYVTLNFVDAGTGSARYASIRKNFDSPFDLRIRASASTSLAPIIFETSNNTERMRIDTSGNVGIGTTLPQAALDLGEGTGGKAITWGGPTGTARYANIFGAYSSGSLVLARGFTGSTSTDTYVSTYTGSTGNTGIRLDATGFINFFTDALSSQTAGNAFTPTPRMRIDSSGNLLVGTTGQIGTEKLGVEQSSATGQSAYFYNSSASYTGGGVIINTARAANTAFSLLNAYSAGVVQFYVGGSGFIYSSQLAGGATTLSVNASGQIIRTPSDASLKTNIQPITYGLDTVMKLKPIKHEWVESIDMGAPSIGFIAQDMELEVPEVVSGEEYKSIDYPKLTAVLTKAIQEQQAIITSLTDRITALETK